MRRRSKVGGEPAKARRGKAVTPKQRAAPKAVRGRSSSVAGQQTQVVQLTRERDEAREQQKATCSASMAICSTWRRRLVRRWNLLNSRGGADRFSRDRTPLFLIVSCGQSR